MGNVLQTILAADTLSLLIERKRANRDQATALPAPTSVPMKRFRGKSSRTDSGFALRLASPPFHTQPFVGQNNSGKLDHLTSTIKRV
jgi:hypothetical protein